MFRENLLLVIAVSLLFSLGLVMIFDTTSAEILDLALDKSTHQALIRQFIYAVGGLGLAYFVYRIGYRTLLQSSPKLLILFTIFLALCLVPGIGREVNGSKRWISLLGFSFQPSEFVKYLVPLYFIHYLMQKPADQMTFKEFLRLMGVLGIPMALILIEPNNGTVGVIAVTLVLLFFLTKVPFKYWALPLCLFFVIGSISATQLSYVKARLRVYWNPELDLKGKGHQPFQAKIAAGSGKLFGLGPGKSLQKLRYLPEAQNDYIAAIFAEEFGFMGMCLLIALYMFIAYSGFSIAYQTQSFESFTIASFVTFLISFQAFMNLGVVSGFLPSTGLNLPFFSQGGTSLMANMMGLGILLNIGQERKQVSCEKI